MPKIGDKIRILYMQGEPQYTGKEGVVEKISPAYPPADIPEQWYGSWGGCAVQPAHDRVEVIKNG